MGKVMDMEAIRREEWEQSSARNAAKVYRDRIMRSLNRLDAAGDGLDMIEVAEILRSVSSVLELAELAIDGLKARKNEHEHETIKPTEPTEGTALASLTAKIRQKTNR